MKVVLGRIGLDKIIANLLAQQAKMTNVISKIELKLANAGFEFLAGNAPMSDIDGNQKGTIQLDHDPDGYRISYMGEDVAYIEFGTGYKGGTSKYPDVVNLARAGWEYDIHNHGINGWYYYGKTDGLLRFSQGGIAPQMPVYKSYLQLKNVADSIIKEVMNEEFN